MELAERWPRSIGFDALCAAARARLEPARVADPATRAQDAQSLGRDLLTAYTASIVEFHVQPSRFTTQLSARPVASPVARLQAQKGCAITNLRHETVVLDEFRRQIVQRLDGEHDREALVEALKALVGTGVLRVTQENAAVTEAGALSALLEQGLEQALPTLASSALLIG